MAGTVAGNRAASTPTEWLRGLWEYYRDYTHTAAHAIATAALTAFGLLVFVDQLFAVVAIASYVVPPVALYALDADAGKPSAAPTASGDRADAGTVPDGRDGDTDSDGDDGDTDSDGGDGDTDSDG